MTKATVLADALVEAGILDWMENSDGRFYRVKGDSGLYEYSPEPLTNDWRVAGKVLESMNWYDLYKFMDNRTSPGSAQAMNMKKVTPRAIIEAWYEARQ